MSPKRCSTGGASGGRAHLSGCLFSLLLLSVVLASCRAQPRKPAGNPSHSAVKIQVAEDGIYAVSQSDLQSSGLAVTKLSYQDLRLSESGETIAYYLDGDNLVFFGQAPDDRYVPTRTYLLELGTQGEAMGEIPSPPSTNTAMLASTPKTIRLEENLKYLAEASNAISDDPWFWQTLGQSQKISLPLNLPNVADGSGALRLRLWGKTYNPQVDDDHDFDLLINDQKLGTVRWDGQTDNVSQIEVPEGILIPGENTITLDNEVTGASILDIMELDWVELEVPVATRAVDDRLEIRNSSGTAALSGFSGKPLLIDVSEPSSPRVLTKLMYEGERLLVELRPDMKVIAVGPSGYLTPNVIEPLLTSNWSDPENQADLIIIASYELAPALSPLIEARAAQDIRGVVVPLEEIFDGFGYGVASPESIRRFIAFAYESWQSPRPRYLLIVGDATADYRDYLGLAPRNPVPAPMVRVAFGGETVSDARLADVDDDHRPDLAVGRWPVDSVGDVNSLVERTLAYEDSVAPIRTIFAADGTETQFADALSRFIQESEFPEDESELLVGAPAEEVVARWNEGVWLTTYMGHGSVERWGKDDVFNPQAVRDLRGANPPIVLQFTCLTGLFAHPELTSLSETMLRHHNGPVLIIAATSLTLSVHQEPFALAIMQRLRDPDIVRIGDAFKEAKLSLAIEDSLGLLEVNDTFVLFGDPSARIVRPAP